MPDSDKGLFDTVLKYIGKLVASQSYLRIGWKGAFLNNYLKTG